MTTDLGLFIYKVKTPRGTIETKVLSAGEVAAKQRENVANAIIKSIQ